MSVIIEQATKLVSWGKARLAERTSWDGGVVIAVSVCCLLYTSPSPRDQA